jgi:hypothetical protein
MDDRPVGVAGDAAAGLGGALDGVADLVELGLIGDGVVDAVQCPGRGEDPGQLGVLGFELGSLARGEQALVRRLVARRCPRRGLLARRD